MDPELLRQWLPIGISVVSLLLASIALGWNVYRDVILKARVRVKFNIVRIVPQGRSAREVPQYLNLSATNHGPGSVRIQIMEGEESPLWRRLLRRRKYFVILSDHTNPMNRPLPHKLEVGDVFDLYLPYDKKCFLAGKATHIGIRDSFGRVHYAPKSHLRAARKAYRRDFQDHE